VCGVVGEAASDFEKEGTNLAVLIPTQKVLAFHLPTTLSSRHSQSQQGSPLVDSGVFGRSAYIQRKISSISILARSSQDGWSCGRRGSSYWVPARPI
jgi:hypothetical protein